MSLIIGTQAVNTDEPCLNLSEVNLVRPDSKGIDRYLILTVIRNDKPEEFRVDLGSAKNFKVEEFRIPGGAIDERTGKIYIEHNVGELLEIANTLRERPREEPPQGDGLIQAFRDQPDVRRRARKKVSSFGYGGTIQRS